MIDTGSVHLFDRLAGLERRIRDAVALRRSVDPHAEDPFRGLYLSDEAIDALLEHRRTPFAPVTEIAPLVGLARLAATVPLTQLDVELLLIAVAPDVDSRFEQFYGYLNDDVTRRRASVGLALRLCGVPESAAAGRARLDADAPLITSGLLAVDDPNRPFLSRSLRVPDSVVSHLLGDTRPDPALADIVRLGTEDLDLPGADLLVRALTGQVRLIYLRERPGSGARELASAALSLAGFTALTLDAGSLATDADLARALRREALLRGAGIVIGPIDGVGFPRELSTLTHAAIPVPTRVARMLSRASG